MKKKLLIITLAFLVKSMSAAPIHNAAEKDDVNAALRELQEKRSAITSRRNFDKATPLHVCAEFGSMRVMRLLLSRGASVHAKDSFGSTPLHWAAAECKENALKLLIASQGKVDAQDKLGNTLLHVAAGGDSIRTVTFLLEAGAGVNSFNKIYSTPLDEADENDEIRSLLLAHGARSIHGKRKISFLEHPKTRRYLERPEDAEERRKNEPYSCKRSRKEYEEEEVEEKAPYYGYYTPEPDSD